MAALLADHLLLRLSCSSVVPPWSGTGLVHLCIPIHHVRNLRSLRPLLALSGLQM